MGKGEPGGSACSASAQRHLPIPAMTPFDDPQLEWPEHDCRHTRVSQLEGGRDFVDEPQHTPSFFYAHRTCGRVSTPYRINLPGLPGIFMHPHRMDDQGSVKHLWETTGV
jgi:hypothetical protein